MLHEGVFYRKSKTIPFIGEYVALIRNSNRFAYSNDAVTWYDDFLPTIEDWSSICYGDNKFVAVARNTDTMIYTSSSTGWSIGTMPTVADWVLVRYGNGNFIAVADDGQTALSVDGVNWVSGGNLGYSGTRVLLYLNGVGLDSFVTWSVQSGRIMRTNNAGVTWSGVGNSQAGTSYVNCGADIAPYSRYTFVRPNYVNTGGIAYFSYTGSMGSGNFNASSIDMVFVNPTAVMICTNGNVYHSTTGTSFSLVGTLPLTSNDWKALIYGVNSAKYVAIAKDNTNVAAYSSDGLNWTQTQMPFNGEWFVIAAKT